jgi:hypothetical protein
MRSSFITLLLGSALGSTASPAYAEEAADAEITVTGTSRRQDEN